METFRISSGQIRYVLILVVGGAVSVQATPALTPGGIVNAASFRPAILDGGGLAQGAIATAFGTGLGPRTGVSTTTFPLEKTLAGVSIRIAQGGVSVDAIPLFVRTDQINFLVPSNAPVGQATITVAYNSEASPAAPISVVPVSFGIFSDSARQAVAQNYLPDAPPALNSRSSAARPGQIVIVYGTGFGAISSPDNLTPPVNDADRNVNVLVGGVAAKRLYAGRSPCCAGLDQLVFQLADDSPSGCTLPLVVQAGGVYSNIAFLSVAKNGGSCPDSVAPPLPAKTGNTIHIGQIILSRIGVFGFPYEFEAASGIFYSGDVNQLTVTDPYFVPQVGQCYPKTSPVGAQTGSTGSGSSSQSFALDAGPPLKISGPGGQRILSGPVAGGYSAIFNLATDPPAFLTPGRYTVTGTGGADVGPFTAVVNVPAPPNWVNRYTFSTVDKSQELMLNVNGIAPESAGVMVISGNSTDSGKTVNGSFSCYAALPGSTYSVPAWVLAQLPSGTQGSLTVGAEFYDASTFSLPTFSAPGLDFAMIGYTWSSTQSVSFISGAAH